MRSATAPHPKFEQPNLALVYVTIQLPPIEQWKPELAKLPKAQSDRVHEAGFYEMLSARITAHVLSRYPRE
ncbi:hypothetical protein [Stieleria varia]|uniref:hypothetical protein n=1 Tax=Stieleria varia TaxID=2528005 RepID=UPI0011B783A8|nr:hypothetical protein [Stieleria varia]